MTWELKGKYPKIFKDPVVGEIAKELYDDAHAVLDQFEKDPSIVLKGVYGFFPANSVGDDIEIYKDESRNEVLTTLYTLRQQVDKGPETINYCLADFVACRKNSS